MNVGDMNTVLYLALAEMTYRAATNLVKRASFYLANTRYSTVWHFTGWKSSISSHWNWNESLYRIFINYWRPIAFNYGNPPPIILTGWR